MLKLHCALLRYLCWSPCCTQHWKNNGTAISHQAHTYTRSPDATNARERVSIAHVNVGALVQAAREGIQQGGLAGPRGPQQQCKSAWIQDAAHCV